MESNYIGALWVKESKKGMRYFSGNIEVGGQKIQIAVFKNTKKSSDKAPGYNIVESKPIERAAPEPNFEDDIPF